MKIVSVVFLVLASLTLLGCPDDKAGGSPAAASGTAKAATSAAPASSGGW